MWSFGFGFNIEVIRRDDSVFHASFRTTRRGGSPADREEEDRDVCLLVNFSPCSATNISQSKKPFVSDRRKAKGGD